MTRLTLLDSDNPEFPPCSFALRNPDGLLAAGGNLEPRTLVKAYRNGIFPWFNPGEPIMWWSPDPRAVIFPEQLHISKSLTKFIRKCPYRFTRNAAFKEVITGCSNPRKGEHGTWITPEMINAYLELHQLGVAHSVEVWDGDQLAGGVYGIVVGTVFCGESMFSTKTNASKLALKYLTDHAGGLTLIDCQVGNPHLDSLGCTLIPRSEFIGLLKKNQKESLDWLE